LPRPGPGNPGPQFRTPRRARAHPAPGPRSRMPRGPARRGTDGRSAHRRACSPSGMVTVFTCNPDSHHIGHVLVPPARPCKPLGLPVDINRSEPRETAPPAADSPGRSSPAPAAGLVAKLHAVRGDARRPATAAGHRIPGPAAGGTAPGRSAACPCRREAIGQGTTPNLASSSVRPGGSREYCLWTPAEPGALFFKGKTGVIGDQHPRSGSPSLPGHT